MWIRIRVPALMHSTKKNRNVSCPQVSVSRLCRLISRFEDVKRDFIYPTPFRAILSSLCAHSRVYPYVKHTQISDSIKSSLWSDSTPDWFNRFCATPASNYHCHNQINIRLFACGHKGKWKGHWRVDERASEFIGMGRGQRETEICRTISFTWETERTDLHSSCVYLTLLNHGFLNFRTASKLR